MSWLTGAFVLYLSHFDVPRASLLGSDLLIVWFPFHLKHVRALDIRTFTGLQMSVRHVQQIRDTCCLPAIVLMTVDASLDMKPYKKFTFPVKGSHNAPLF